ncbi:unnamed protein product, partial [Choristocarpus tenellus]
ESSSYIFCPKAYGMMSAGMIDRASKAAYDFHHPGARPVTGPVMNPLGLRATHGRIGENVKVNVVGSEHHDNTAPHRAAPTNEPLVDVDSSLALVASSSNTLRGDGFELGSGRNGRGTGASGRGDGHGRGGHGGGFSGGSGGNRGGVSGSRAEYLTMLVPVGSLDWGKSSWDIRTVLNSTNEGETGWVEIGCEVLSARLVRDINFSTN